MISNRAEAVEYLDSLIGSGIRPGLDRMMLLLDASGHPERSVRSVLVAGTNGKGSTAAILSSIAHQAGYRVGLYTSPHLVRLEERWRVGEVPIEEEVLVAAVSRLRETASRAKLRPTYFEALTLLAFFIFEMRECSLSILEVGMGGRLDATNVTDPVVSVITPIDLDHQEWLGNSIEKIAFEKLGIARSGRPLIVAPQAEAVLEVMKQRCAELECELIDVSSAVELSDFHTGLTGSAAEIETTRTVYRVETRLAGMHQAGNLATAVRAAEALSEHFREIGRDEIIRGCRETKWRGRLESFRLGSRLVVVDGAHNPAGSRSAARFIERYLPG
ncbi:MAG: Mur ligase family protein, partial [Thermoanaerobaculia bacterium]|nr:Mur ligase family protein [Thermoanaerobaculia bacterium]